MYVLDAQKRHFAAKVIATEKVVENAPVPVDIVQAAPIVDGVVAAAAAADSVVFPAAQEAIPAPAPGEEILVSSLARPAPGGPVPVAAAAAAAAVAPATYAAVNPYLSYAPTYTHASVTPVFTAPTKTQFHIQDEFGQYRFGYAEPSANREEIRLADGSVTGHYNYVDADGHIQTVKYVADALGFRVAGTNIPVAEVQHDYFIAFEKQIFITQNGIVTTLTVPCSSRSCGRDS